MNCDKVRELLPFLDDGSIDPDTADTVRTHLDECSPCHTEYQEVTGMLNQVRDVLIENELAPVPGYLGMVRKKIEKKRKARIFYYRLVSAAAVIVFAVSLTIYGYMGLKTTEPMSEQYVAGESLSEFDDFIASEYLSGYDLNELVSAVEVVDEPVIINTLLTYNYDSITPEDVIEIITEEELPLVFTSQER